MRRYYTLRLIKKFPNKDFAILIINNKDKKSYEVTSNK